MAKEKDPLSSPHEHGLVCGMPGKSEHACNYLEHVDTPDLKMKSDTSVLTEAFYSPGDSLNWSKGALDSPMGTDIPNPRNLKP